MRHDPELQARFETLQAKYLTTFEDFILDLDALLIALTTGGDQAPVMEAIRYRVHRIAGTAPALGYRVVGEWAAEVEDAIDQWNAHRSGLLEQQIAAGVNTLLDEMEKALDAELPAPASSTGT